jgi:hypothetical protein
MTRRLPSYSQEQVATTVVGSSLLPITMPLTVVPPLSDAHSQDLSYRDRAAPRDGDDPPMISLTPGRWPRVFPGL